MSTHEIAVNVFEVLTLSTTLLLRISLIPDFRRMHKNHSTGEMSVMPCLLLFTNCYVGMFYAIAVNNMMPLFAQAIVGVVTGIFFNYFFYRWAADKRAVVKAFIGSFTVCFIVTLYSVLALAGYTNQSQDSVSTTLGFMTIGTSVGMYTSPMATIATVLRTKTASSMPFTMGVVNVFNSFNWATYAALVDNKFILGPNIAGFILGCIQLILTFIYRRATSEMIEDVKLDGRVSVIILSSDRGGERIVLSSRGKSPSFAAVKTPFNEGKITTNA
uniref:Sugar transporter SWEET1 n=1 Tax=Peronospora matthiolae TaxID=2874970 RepID=A0AAV1V095_9STRA